MVVENAQAPDVCSENDVIVTVKAASVHVIDAEICSGYGKTLRKILQRIYNKVCLMTNEFLRDWPHF